MPPKKLAFVFGTRPEVIKLAPVILEARAKGHETVLVLTGQHRQMAADLMRFFGLEADIDLGVMKDAQSLGGLSARILQRLDQVSGDIGPCDFWIVQGDTTSACMAAYWAFCRGQQVVHVEAGLRTYDLAGPFPEEANRQLISRIASIHFAPTQAAVKNLKKERVSGKVLRVGNTGVDALFWTLRKQDKLPHDVSDFLGSETLVLVTAHRRESFGEGISEICEGILRTLQKLPALKIVFPVHLNPNIKKPVTDLLGQHPNILLCEPLSYPVFVSLMNRSAVILTDSGGIQEEAPSLKKPILVMRDETERPEGVRAGYAKLVGPNSKRITAGLLQALKQGCSGRGPNPYGDGKASQRIIRSLARD